MNSSKAKNHCWALSTCLDIGLRSLNPFMPRVTKHLHERLLTFSFNHQQLGFPKVIIHYYIYYITLSCLHVLYY